ncbi:MAG TPA: hypothetical protein VF659_01580 [Pyrinomonadaceae bacterium]
MSKCEHLFRGGRARSKTRGRSALAALAVVLACAGPAAAQGVPRVKGDAKRADRAAWRKVLAWPEACEEAYRAAYPPGEDYGGLEFHRLGRGLHLVEVVCDGGGVQPGAVFVLYDERRPRRPRLLKLKGFDGEDEAGRPLPYSEVRALTKFVPRTRELLLMSKADAMGTCGLYVRYSFARGRPRVVEARRQDDCGGPDATPDTSRWPKVRLKE